MKIFILFSFMTSLYASEYSIDLFCQDYNVGLTKLEIYNANIANAETTRTVEGGYYKKKIVESCMDGHCIIKEDSSEPIMKYHPKHPDADENGYVAFPNINIYKEMAELIKTQRVLEAVIENNPIKSKDLLVGDKFNDCFKEFPLVKKYLDYKSFLGR